jgi:hypothetical protein
MSSPAVSSMDRKLPRIVLSAVAGGNALGNFLSIEETVGLAQSNTIDSILSPNAKVVLVSSVVSRQAHIIRSGGLLS